jgi:tetratricopeptide (TPR) repeat protein
VRTTVVVGLVAVLVHVRSIGFDFTYLDDRDLIVEDHAFLARPANLLRAFARPYMHVVDRQHSYYRPLVTVSYALDAQWCGLRAFGYHLTNVVLHALASVLFLALLRRLAVPGSPEAREAAEDDGIWLVVTSAAALAFAVHPVLASAVAWIPGRNDTLLAVFALSSWLSFLADATKPSWSSRLLHLLFFCLALLTKESAVAIPLVCILHLALLEPDALARSWRSRALLAYAIAWCAGIAVRFLAHPLSAAVPVAEFVRNLPVSVSGLGQLVLPVNPSLLSVREDVPLWPGLAAAGLVAAAARWVPGIRWRVVAVGASAFVLFLAPSLAVPGALVQNTRLYLPACGAIVAISEIVRALARERGVLIAFSGVTVAALAAIALAYEGTFRDRRAFARAAVVAAPHSPLAHFCLGQSDQIDGDQDRALAEYRLALLLGAIDGVHNNIAVIHMANARWSAAEEELRDELAIDPRYARAYSNLGIVLRREGRIDEAQQVEDRARELAAEGP